MKIRRPLFIPITVLMCFSFLLAMGNSATAASSDSSEIVSRLIIDDFEDGNITASPEWWTFDKALLSFSSYKGYGESSLVVKGKATNWYVGGMGNFVGRDVSEYNTFAISVYGNGAKSGTIEVQLYDDDNNTGVLEQDDNWDPTHDDRFVYKINVDWKGWKDIEIPISSFEDTNKGIGNDKYDPIVAKGSSGLLHFQLIFNATSQLGSVNLNIDNVKLIKKTK